MIHPDIQLLREHAIIPPPKTDTRRTKKHRIIVDSRDRNIGLFPNQARYDIKFDEDSSDVISAELTLTDFPSNDYNVTKHSNKLNIDGTVVIIPEGIYTEQILVDKLNENTLHLDITFEFDSNSRKITCLSRTEVIIKCKSENQVKYDYEQFIDVYELDSIGKTLGLGLNDYKINGSFEFPFVVNLVSEKYIIMYIQRAKVYFSKNNNTHQAFAIIPNDTTNLISLTDETIVKVFNPPIANFNTLSFKFLDYQGNLFDFQNKDHRFELLLETHKQMPKYSNIF